MSKKKILIYYTGTIGDTIIAFPAFQMIRQQYPTAHIMLLSALHGKFSAPQALLEPTIYVDDFISYTLPKHRVMRIAMAGLLICKLRLMRFDELIYLARDDDSERRKRDKVFFRHAGIQTFHGIDKYTCGECNGKIKNVSQRIVDTLVEDGLGEPHLVENYGDFQLTDAEKEKTKRWFDSLNIPNGYIPVVYGMGGKTQPCKWPTSKHREVLENIVGEYKCIPLFFGDESTRNDEEAMIKLFQCGFRVAPQGFTLRESICAMTHCHFYIGHDTGTMHMASAAGLPCIGIFSARNPVGKWYPPGNNNIFLRHSCECSECGLPVCSSNPARCIDMISPQEVIDAVEKMLRSLL